ncbi:MAG: exonuclease SbcCD subunit D [Chloroflexi bacterium]|nr:exonuclease SbcCD subunit D [Chloroflexota bacterium]MCI0898872.1 exonuclease SbcCD subunit D [Chloroflexota bacterium]MCI0901764.1 exonuclease SbcCD subunit D [Chloroflexota bacterium]
MRILHFSDLHIGVENYGRTDPETGLSTRLGDFLDSLDQVVEFALNEGVDLVLLAGDAYKGRDPTQTHQREFAKRLNRLSRAGIPIFLLVGNHDLPAASSRATAVDIFPTLEVANIYVGANLETYNVATPSGPLQVLAVPWPRRSAILSREESRGLSIEQVRQALEERLTEGIERTAKELDPNVPAILTGHVTVNGATVGTERSMMLGQDHVLLVSALDRPEVEYVALGHIHKHQILRLDPPMVVYSGSLQRVDFSEEGDEKGFCVVDLDPAEPQGRRMTNFEFHKLKARNFVTVDVSVEPQDVDPTATVVRAIARKDIADSVVRVRISLAAETDAHLSETEIRAALEPAHFIASISREVTGARRTRISPSEGEDLQPMQALGLYLDSKKIEGERREKIMRKAEELIELDSAEPEEAA